MQWLQLMHYVFHTVFRLEFTTPALGYFLIVLKRFHHLTTNLHIISFSQIGKTIIFVNTQIQIGLAFSSSVVVNLICYIRWTWYPVISGGRFSSSCSSFYYHRLALCHQHRWLLLIQHALTFPDRIRGACAPVMLYVKQQTSHLRIVKINQLCSWL